MDNPYYIAIVVAAVLILFGFVMLLATRYKRCPSNRVLVVYGKVGEGLSSKTIHGGGSFVWPLIQDFDFLHLDPMQIEVPLKGALSIENIRVNVPSVFTVAIGTEQETMQNAAVRLLGLSTEEIMKQAEDIIFGQLRQVIASMRIEDINRDREKFLESIQQSLEPELDKIGLELINVNITDITDESGYIEAIGRKAASQAIQQAEIDVAEQSKKGAIGVAEATKEKLVQVASAVKIQEIGTKEAEKDRMVRIAQLEKEKAVGQKAAAFEQEALVKQSEREMRISVAEANATAVEGENLSKAVIAETNANLRVKEANAYQLGETRHREAEAAVRQAQYVAEARTAEALATKVEAEKRAELEAVARAEKAKQIVDAEAQAEQTRIEAQGQAAALFAKLEAQARGEYEILAKKAEGLRLIVEGCGGSQQAFQMLMLEHLEHLSETAATAISNIKFDKVVVWDGGNGNGTGGAAGFLQSLAKSLPPMLNILRDVGGVDMPQFFGKLVAETDDASKAPESGADRASNLSVDLPVVPKPPRKT
ncbi:MAG TPA: SPFH domain-containing protein [Planctomycetota bacterium]|nr:SPFH domain-containing protein [Planctomycetota bacterium]